MHLEVCNIIRFATVAHTLFFLCKLGLGQSSSGYKKYNCIAVVGTLQFMAKL